MSEHANDGLGALLAGLFSAEQHSTQARVETLLTQPDMDDIIAAITDLNPEHFDLLFNLQLRELTDALIDDCLPDSISDRQRLLFLFSHANYIEAHFQRLFQQHEGQGHAADKSRTLLRALAHCFSSGQPISFDYSGPASSHLPEKIFTHHQIIYDFYEGLYRLYHGQPELYLKALGSLLDADS